MLTEQSYYETPELWLPGNYVGEQEERAAITQSWIPSTTRSVLDAGCGNGVLTNQLMANKFVVGADRSFAALKWVQAPRCQLDLAHLPFADNSYDLLVCTEVLEHLPAPLFPMALHELARVARHHILVSVPYEENLEMRRITCPHCGCRFHRYYHVRNFTRRRMETLFGFDPTIRLERASGIFPISETATTRLKQATRLLLDRLHLRQPRFYQNVICPQCAYVQAEQNRSEAPSAKNISLEHSPSRQGSPVVTVVNQVLPLHRSYRWWLALYRKESAAE